MPPIAPLGGITPKGSQGTVTAPGGWGSPWGGGCPAETQLGDGDSPTEPGVTLEGPAMGLGLARGCWNVPQFGVG